MLLREELPFSASPPDALSWLEQLLQAIGIDSKTIPVSCEARSDATYCAGYRLEPHSDIRFVLVEGLRGIAGIRTALHEFGHAYSQMLFEVAAGVPLGRFDGPLFCRRFASLFCEPGNLVDWREKLGIAEAV